MYHQRRPHRPAAWLRHAAPAHLLAERHHQHADQANSPSDEASLRVPGRLRQRAETTGLTVLGSTHDETIHTTASHPWLTANHGWVRAGQLTLGEKVRRADGSTATVVSLLIVPGAADMWDLTVSNVHTFAVGSGAYVVHNCTGGIGDGSGDGTGSRGTGDSGAGSPRPPSPAELNDAGASTQSGGRSGRDIQANGLPNSYMRSASNAHIWVYDGEGKLQWDISPERAKYWAWNTNPITGQSFLRDTSIKVGTPPEWLLLF